MNQGFRGWSGAASATAVTNAVAADTNVTPTNTFIDGPTVTLAPGTWLLTGTVSVFSSTAGSPAVTAKLWDGASSVLASTQVNLGSTSTTTTLSLSGAVTLYAPATYRISVASSVVTTVTIKAATNNNASGNTASTLSAIPVLVRQ
jgi:hypothetical protein